MWSLVVGAVLAHQPHAVLVDAARAPDGAMLAILDPHDTSQLVTGDGRHFAFTGGEATDEELTAAAFVDGTWVVADAEGGVWTSPDQRTWALTTSLGTPVRALDGGSSLLVATAAGLWSGPPDALVAEAADTAFIEAAWGPQGRIAVAADGRVWSGRATTPLVAFAPLPDDARALSAALAEAPYAGTDRGIYRYDAGWQPCGALPATAEGPDATAVHLLVADGDALLAATGAEALFVSTDACATWERRSTGDVVVIGGIGYAQTAAEAFVWAARDGDSLWVAGFDGLAVSEDDGATWAHPDLLPADYSRGISLAPGRLYLGEYAGGVAFTDDGATWGSSGAGLTGLHGNDLVAGPGPDEVWHVTDLVVHRSTDRGATWQVLDAPMERAREVRLLDDGVWLLGGDERGDVPGSRIAVTTDGGASWTLDEAYAGVAGENAILDLFDARLDDADLRIALLQKPAGLVLRRDGAWTATPTFPGFASGAVAWPPDAPERLVLATTEGVWLSDDGGESFVPTTQGPGGHPRALLQDDDGRLLLIDRGGRSWASEDGGDTWLRVDEAPLPAAVHDATGLHDGFAVVATTTGPWWTDDGGATWSPSPRLQRLEDDGFHVLREGDRRSFTCFGDAIRVLAPPSAVIAAFEDDAPVALDAEHRADLALGWHDLELVADATIDAIECTAPGEPIPLPAARRCGCESPGTRAWTGLGALFAALTLRRGTTSPRSAASPAPR